MKKIYGAITVFIAVALFKGFLISCSDDDKYTEMFQPTQREIQLLSIF